MTVIPNFPEGQAPLILIVEDDMALANLYDQKFKKDGFNTLLAHDGETGLNLALTKKPDFILLDMMLPKLTGIEVYKKLIETPEGKRIPVIFLTNNTEIQERDNAMKLGARDYLAKAMHTPEDIEKRVKQILGIGVSSFGS